jgi:hypothetical protein
MSTRRTVIFGLAATTLAAPLVSFALPAVARDGLLLGRAGPERPIPWKGAWLRPLDNDNARYYLEMQVDRFPDEDRVFLRRGELLLESRSRGGGDDRWTVGFELDRATAELLSGWLGAPRRERSPLGQGLRGSFSLLGGTTVRLELTNGGSAPVGVILGGRNRGPRDNQFAFQVQRDGVPLPPLEGYDFGGLSYVELLGPGESLQREADAALWAKFDAPGLYRLACRYEAELVPGDKYPEFPDHSHEFWDAAWEGTVELRR